MSFLSTGAERVNSNFLRCTLQIFCSVHRVRVYGAGTTTFIFEQFDVEKPGPLSHT